LVQTHTVPHFQIIWKNDGEVVKAVHNAAMLQSAVANRRLDCASTIRLERGVKAARARRISSGRVRNSANIYSLGE
jgi:hypothetical protein